jgi:hypothetical protein
MTVVKSITDAAVCIPYRLHDINISNLIQWDDLHCLSCSEKGRNEVSFMHVAHIFDTIMGNAKMMRTCVRQKMENSIFLYYRFFLLYYQNAFAFWFLYFMHGRFYIFILINLCSPIYAQIIFMSIIWIYFTVF